ncbi:hypothetical protein C8T65DRAFT_678240 [Cerioporus squamosus]|nr:hypothetical protein C8T65DRAFT_678240 [Cerioporus squamosus]
MNSRLFSVLLLQSALALLVQGTIYITKPLPGSTCSGGKSCTVEWLDDGVVPLLSDIRTCHVALYNGNQVLIQQISPVDVSAQHALTFTPDPNAGPNSSGYYINFTSVNPVSDSTYYQFSTMFTLDSMTGSFGSPVASDTAAIPVPSTLTDAPSTSATSTSTVGGSSSSPSSAPVSSSSADTSAGPSSSSGSSASSSSSSSSLPGSSSSSSSSTPTTSTTPSTSTTGDASNPATTLTVLATSTRAATSAPAAPTASSSSSSISGGSANHALDLRASALSMPLVLSSVIVFAFGLLM